MVTPEVSEQIVAARPAIANQTAVVMDAEMRSALRDSIVESAAISPRAAPLSNSTRRRAALATLSLAVCVGVAAIVFAVVPNHPPSAAAAILAKTVSALASPDVGVVVAHQVESGPKGVSPSFTTVWLDPNDSLRFRLTTAGLGLGDSEEGGYVEAGKAETISVNFANRSAFITPAVPHSSRELYSITEGQLQAAQRSGDLKVVGSQRVNGVNTVHLSGSNNRARVDIWINPVDYHLVRVRVRFSDGYQTVQNVRLLPPTPANMALLNVTVPSGFTVMHSPLPRTP